jgi:hypothetical protein
MKKRHKRTCFVQVFPGLNAHSYDYQLFYASIR